MLWAQPVLLIAVALLPLQGPAPDARWPVARHRAGDDPRWAAPDWDDSDWAPGRIVPARKGIHWVRLTLVLPANAPTDFAPLALAGSRLPDIFSPIDVAVVPAPYSYELYWDGRLIGRSGVVGRTREEEVVGRLDNFYSIPSDLRGHGRHVIAVRLSSFHYNFPADEFGVGPILTNYHALHESEFRRVAFPLVGLGGSTIVALICFLLYWLAGRWRPLLLCGLASLGLALFYFLVAWRWLHNDPYTWFYPRLVLATSVMSAVAVLFPWLLLELFDFRKKFWWLAPLPPALLLAWLVPPLYEFKSLGLCYAMLSLCLAISFWASRQGRTGARWVLGVVLLGLLIVRADRREFLHPTFFVTFGLLVLVLFAILGVQMRAQRKRVQAARLTTARLETELLKKNIQPHFLLNTLTTIMEVIEREPRVAVGMIEALAAEFRILARIAGEKLIPLEQELALCRAHLEVMSLRKGARCVLTCADNLDPSALVPPALFHTLIENGLTHLLPQNGVQAFDLSATVDRQVIRYTLIARGESPEAVPSDSRREGTGLRYVKARLEESFPGRWTLQGEPITGGWRTIIEIAATGPEEGGLS